MKLFWCPQTRAVRIVWMLNELGVPYEKVLIDIRDASRPRDPEFARASPMGKVPALADGEARLADSAAICLYLADQYPKAGLAPKIGDPRRADYFWWMLFTPGVIEPCMMEKFQNAKPNRFSAGWGDFDLMIETLERGLRNGPWILGDKFSAADVMLGSSAVFMKQFKLLPDNKTIGAYADRCLGRKAYKDALAAEAG